MTTFSALLSIILGILLLVLASRSKKAERSERAKRTTTTTKKTGGGGVSEIGLPTRGWPLPVQKTSDLCARRTEDSLSALERKAFRKVRCSHAPDDSKAMFSFVEYKREKNRAKKVKRVNTQAFHNPPYLFCFDYVNGNWSVGVVIDDPESNDQDDPDDHEDQNNDGSSGDGGGSSDPNIGYKIDRNKEGSLLTHFKSLFDNEKEFRSVFLGDDYDLSLSYSVLRDPELIDQSTAVRFLESFLVEYEQTLEEGKAENRSKALREVEEKALPYIAKYVGFTKDDDDDAYTGHCPDEGGIPSNEDWEDQMYFVESPSSLTDSFSNRKEATQKHDCDHSHSHSHKHSHSHSHNY